MRFLEQHDCQRTHDEHHHRVGQAREQPHLEDNLLARCRALLAHAQLRHRNDQVHQQRNGAGTGQQEFEHCRRGHVVGEYRQERRASRQHHRPVRRAALVGALGHSRCVTATAQGEQHARSGVQRRVEATGHGNQHHQVDDQLGVRNAHAFQHGLVGTYGRQGRVVPWHQGHNDEDRQQVEQTNPPDHRVGGLGDLLARVLRFRCGDGDDLGAHEGEHGGQDCCQHRAHAVGHEALRIKQVGNAADLAGRQEAENGSQTKNHKAHDCHDFDQCKPELELTIVFHAEQVGRCQQQGDDQGKRPDRHIREPGMKDGRGRVGFQRNHQHPEPPVQPADGETGPVTDRAVSVGGE